MNEYTVQYLNGIISYLLGGDWKEIILEARQHAERRKFQCTKIKYIIDMDSNVIKDIDENLLTYSIGSLNEIIKTHEQAKMGS